MRKEIISNKIGINNLILFSLYTLSDKKKKSSFEEIMEECFVLFPEIFKFQTIKKWPDSRKLDRPLRFLRKEKLIEGNPNAGFFLTKPGRELSEEISKVLNQRKLEI